MYDHIEGRLVSRSPARAVVSAGGVGFDVAVPIGTDLGAVGDSVRVWTHLVVRDDAHLLYGFADPGTREWFRVLLGVRGVGPGMALGILSGLRVEELHAALLAEDPTPLQRIKGVGKKTADQILLDLRGKAARLAPSPAGEGVLQPRRPPADAATEDALRALVSIGYTDKEARKAVDRAAREVGTDDVERLIRAALQG